MFVHRELLPTRLS